MSSVFQLIKFYLAALTIGEPYDCPLHVGKANGFIANGDATIPPIPVFNVLKNN